MKIFDALRSVLIKEVSTKAPEFPIADYLPWQDYSKMVDESNYLDQYFGWTYKAINTIENGIVPYRPKLMQKKGEEAVELTENPLLKDLHRFNAFQSFGEARRLRLVHQRLTGLAFWYMCKSDAKGYINEFFPLNPTRVWLDTDAFGLPKNYKYRDASGGEHVIPSEQIIVFRDSDPRNWQKGLGVLKASRLAHNSYQLAAEYNMNMFGNMGKPEGILAFDGISETERKRAEQQLRTKYGGHKQAGKTSVLNMIPTWISLTKGQKDLDFVEGLKLMREEILSIHGVPKPLVGLTDSTFTNSQEAQKIFQMYTLKPELEKEAEVLTERLIPNYFGTNSAISANLFFEIEDPVEEDRKEVVSSTVELYGAGIIDRNEARERVGYDPQEDTIEAEPESEEPASPEAPEKSARVKGIDEERFALLRPKVKAFFSKKIDSSENTLTETARSFFEEQKKRFSSELTQKAVSSGDFILNIDKKEEVEITIDWFTSAMLNLAEDANETANLLTNAKINLTASARKQLEGQVKRFANEITDTTMDEMLVIMERMVSEGLGLDESKQLIGDLFDRWKDGGEGITETRAEAIARTENTRISNFVYFENYSKNEAIVDMEWLSAHDRYVRDTHKSADGQRVSKGLPFLVGGEELKYPGDSSGSAENVINCRCVVLPVVDIAETLFDKPKRIKKKYTDRSKDITKIISEIAGE